MMQFIELFRVSLVMSVTVAALTLGNSLITEAFENSPIGWASADGTTIGGVGGTVVTVSDRADLLNYVQKSGKYVIQVDGIIELNLYEQVLVGSDKTIIGLGSSSEIRYGGLMLKDVSNVIIRNLEIWDSYDGDWSGKTHNTDGISVVNSHHVWIDHCEILAHADGLLDVTAQSDYVTISWCIFSNHNKSLLIGAGDNYVADRGKLRVTLHHNYFNGVSGRGLFQRVPSVRFGDVHIFNNYYDSVGVNRTGGTAWGYGIMSRIEADVLVENNYFNKTLDPHEARSDGTNPDLEAIGNIYEECRGAKSQTGSSFTPPYPYSLDDASDVPSIVMEGAGIGKTVLPPPIETPKLTPIPTVEPTPAAVPEPGTLLYFGISLIGVYAFWRKRRKK